MQGQKESIVALRPSFSAHVRPTARRGEWGEHGAAVRFPPATNWRKKMKGRFLLRDLALSIPIFGDPVRRPNHNFGFPRITWDLRTYARMLLALLRSLPPQELARRHPFPVAWPESRCRFPKMTVCLLSPLEDRSSVESNTTPQQRIRKGSRIIFCCGNKVN